MEIDKVIWPLLNTGLSVRQVAAKAQTSTATVGRSWQRWKKAKQSVSAPETERDAETDERVTLGIKWPPKSTEPGCAEKLGRSVGQNRIPSRTAIPGRKFRLISNSSEKNDKNGRTWPGIQFGWCSFPSTSVAQEMTEERISEGLAVRSTADAPHWAAPHSSRMASIEPGVGLP